MGCKSQTSASSWGLRLRIGIGDLNLGFRSVRVGSLVRRLGLLETAGPNPGDLHPVFWNPCAHSLCPRMSTKTSESRLKPP